MDSRPLEADVLLHTAAALLLGVDRAMDRLLSLLPTASKAAAAASTKPAALPDRAEDTAVQQALDEVLEYHRTHRPKNTAKNYDPKQKEWKVSIAPILPEF